MIELLLWLFVLGVSITILVKSSDYFTGSAEKIGLFFGMSPFVIGITIVAIGTSLPELVSSLIAVFSGYPEIVIGNAVGSNVANIFLVLGFAGIFASKYKFKHKQLIFDMNFLLLSTILICFFLWDRRLNLLESIACIFVFGSYIYLTYRREKPKTKTEKVKKALPWKVWFIISLSSLGIYLSAKYTVMSVIECATLLGIGTEVLAASVVAIGTSLPELTVSLIAARKGHLEIAVGNVLGSNIFNALAVIGIAGLFTPFFISQNMLYFMIPILLIATIMFVVVCFDKKLKKWEGVLLLIFYCYFLFRLFI